VSSAHCGRCNKTLSIGTDNRYPRHGDERGTCPLSYQRAPRFGDADSDWTHRSKVAADLAWQMRDCDPAAVRAYLEALPREELLRTAMVALAGVPVDRRREDIFAWVTELPMAVSA
jgi:hypothetical protein